MTGLPRLRGAAELAVLVSELRHTNPACVHDPRFIADLDELRPADIDQMATVCGGCSLLAECTAYGRQGRPLGGFWAGRQYRENRNRPATGRQRPQEAL